MHQLCTDTGCSLEDLTRAMDDRGRWREWERESSVLSAWLDWLILFWTEWYKNNSPMCLQPFTCEFESLWVLHSYDLVSHQSKKLSKFRLNNMLMLHFFIFVRWRTRIWFIFLFIPFFFFCCCYFYLFIYSIYLFYLFIYFHRDGDRDVLFMIHALLIL